MGDRRIISGWLDAIAAFYAFGVVAVAIAMFTNRSVVGEQLAMVHGLPGLAGVPIFLLTILMGVLVVAGLHSLKPWGYWLIMVYMGYLLVVPASIFGKGTPLFANFFWPGFMLIYMFIKRSDFGVGKANNN